MKGNQNYIAEYPKWKLTFQKLFFILYFPIAIVVDVFESTGKRGATVQFIFKKISW
jgi:hypothetical protein